MEENPIGLLVDAPLFEDTIGILLTDHFYFLGALDLLQAEVFRLVRGLDNADFAKILFRLLQLFGELLNHPTFCLPLRSLTRKAFARAIENGLLFLVPVV